GHVVRQRITEFFSPRQSCLSHSGFIPPVSRRVTVCKIFRTVQAPPERMIPDWRNQGRFCTETVPAEYPAPKLQIRPVSPGPKPPLCRWKAMIDPAEEVLA